MSQGERYARMCIKDWTGYHAAMMNGCGNSPWKRWAEWSWKSFGETDDYLINGKTYQEQIRTREVLTMDGKKTRIMERRLVRVK